MQLEGPTQFSDIERNGTAINNVLVYKSALRYRAAAFYP